MRSRPKPWPHGDGTSLRKSKKLPKARFACPCRLRASPSATAAAELRPACPSPWFVAPGALSSPTLSSGAPGEIGLRHGRYSLRSWAPSSEVNQQYTVARKTKQVLPAGPAGRSSRTQTSGPGNPKVGSDPGPYPPPPSQPGTALETRLLPPARSRGRGRPFPAAIAPPIAPVPPGAQHPPAFAETLFSSYWAAGCSAQPT